MNGTAYETVFVCEEMKLERHTYKNDFWIPITLIVLARLVMKISSDILECVRKGS